MSFDDTQLLRHLDHPPKRLLCHSRVAKIERADILRVLGLRNKPLPQPAAHSEPVIGGIVRTYFLQAQLELPHASLNVLAADGTGDVVWLEFAYVYSNCFLTFGSFFLQTLTGPVSAVAKPIFASK